MCDLLWSDPEGTPVIGLISTRLFVVLLIIILISKLVNSASYWPSPSDTTGWGVSPRGAGYLFGSDVVAQFNAANDIHMICRAHQLVMEGYKWHFNETVLTVWSAPNYCYRCVNTLQNTLAAIFFFFFPAFIPSCLVSYWNILLSLTSSVSVWTFRCGNVAAILELDEHLQREFIIFEAAPQETRGIPSKKPVADYFLWSVWVGSHRVSKYPVPFLTSHPPSCCWTVLLVLTLSRRDRKICQSTWSWAHTWKALFLFVNLIPHTAHIWQSAHCERCGEEVDTGPMTVVILHWITRPTSLFLGLLPSLCSPLALCRYSSSRPHRLQSVVVFKWLNVLSFSFRSVWRFFSL